MHSFQVFEQAASKALLCMPALWQPLILLLITIPGMRSFQVFEQASSNALLHMPALCQPLLLLLITIPTDSSFLTHLYSDLLKLLYS